MCVSKNPFKCCCCCSLTLGTWILGVFEILNVICTGFMRNWLGLATSLGMTVLFGLTVYDQHNVTFRKLLYWVYFVLSIAFAVTFAFAIVFLAVTDYVDDEFERACRDTPELYPEKYSDLDNCVSFLHNCAIAMMCLLFLIAVPIRFALANVLKYGWKEQEERRQEIREGQHEPLNNQAAVGDQENGATPGAGGQNAGYYPVDGTDRAN